MLLKGVDFTPNVRHWALWSLDATLCISRVSTVRNRKHPRAPPRSSLWHLPPFCHSICGYTYVCTLAFTQTQEQTRFSEAAANPGLGNKQSSPS